MTSISDFEQLILVCKKHGLTTLKLGDIELQLPGDPKKESDDHTRSEKLDINAETFLAYRSL